MGAAGCIAEDIILQKKRLITKCYLLLLFMHWVMDYLERWYGVCARITVFYHLDKANQMTMDIGKWQRELKMPRHKKKKLHCKGEAYSCHHTQV